MNSRIRVMYMQSIRRRQNVNKEIRALSERVFASSSVMDPEAARENYRPKEEDWAGSK